jgi:hypothetical protein
MGWTRGGGTRQGKLVTDCEPNPAPVPWLPPSLTPDKVDVEAAGPEMPAPTEKSRAIERRCRREFEAIVAAVREAATRPSPTLTFEPMLWARLLGLGRLLFVLWLARVDDEVVSRLPRRWFRASRLFERRGGQSREMGTVFGKVSYRRTYVYCAEAERGYYPTDEALGLIADGFTLSLVGQVCRLATRMSYAAAASVLSWFLRWAPATRTVQELTMGLGGHGQRFQVQAPPPSDREGEVLVIQIDSKGIPTATEAELEARRKPRPRTPAEPSRRHRERDKRRQRAPRVRRDPDDHGKNARMATAVVMYTLAQDPGATAPRLLGPHNTRIHASFSPKRYAFQVARREAEKRGFGPGSGRRIQFIYDGDEALETYRQQYFGDYPPQTIVATADIMHVLEYVWDAAAVVHPHDEAARARWVGVQRDRLMASDGERVREELRAAMEVVPRTGPGTRARRETLETTLRYLTTNAHRLDYRLVRALDLDLASGMVEGIVRSLIGVRFDQGGMRWIAERAEALLQLRCIETNGQWDDFIRWVHDSLAHRDPSTPLRLRSRKPPPMPTLLQPHLAVAQAAAAKCLKS